MNVVVFKTKDNEGRKVLHFVYKYGNAYFHEMRRWVEPKKKFYGDHKILRRFKGYRYIANRQYNQRDTWFTVCAAIKELEK